jgi:hypothetical protein
MIQDGPKGEPIPPLEEGGCRDLQWPSILQNLRREVKENCTGFVNKNQNIPESGSRACIGVRRDAALNLRRVPIVDQSRWTRMRKGEDGKLSGSRDLSVGVGTVIRPEIRRKYAHIPYSRLRPLISKQIVGYEFLVVLFQYQLR